MWRSKGGACVHATASANDPADRQPGATDRRRVREMTAAPAPGADAPQQQPLPLQPPPLQQQQPPLRGQRRATGPRAWPRQAAAFVAARPWEALAYACDAATAVLIVAVQDIAFKQAMTACAALSLISLLANAICAALGQRVVRCRGPPRGEAHAAHACAHARGLAGRPRCRTRLHRPRPKQHTFDPPPLNPPCPDLPQSHRSDDPRDLRRPGSAGLVERAGNPPSGDQRRPPPSHLKPPAAHAPRPAARRAGAAPWGWQHGPSLQWRVQTAAAHPSQASSPAATRPSPTAAFAVCAPGVPRHLRHRLPHDAGAPLEGPAQPCRPTTRHALCGRPGLPQARTAQPPSPPPPPTRADVAPPRAQAGVLLGRSFAMEYYMDWWAAEHSKSSLTSGFAMYIACFALCSVPPMPPPAHLHPTPPAQ